MNVLIAEYFTGGGLCSKRPHGSLPEALCREGDLMLHALARDLSGIAGVRVTTTRDRRLPPPTFSGVEVHDVAAGDDWELRLRELLGTADAFWPIAPETGGTLAALCGLCEQSDCLLLNSSAEAVRCAASKRLTADALRRAGLPCVETWNADERWFGRVNGADRVVLKPDDGVGCENVRVAGAARARDMVRAGDVVQPYIEGKAVSLSILYGGDDYRLAGVNVQEVECRDGGFLLKACVVNGLQNGVHDLDQMAGRLRQAIPGLAGYVGVDCVVRDGDVCIIEINPRLTTSYVGLHRSLGVNPAACVIGLLTWLPVPRLNAGSAAAVRVVL